METRTFKKLLSILVVSVNTLFGQIDSSHKKEDDRGNRYEGYLDYNISSKFQLLGVQWGTIPKYGVTSKLTVRFYIPEDKQNTLIKARLINQGRKLYYMNAKQSSWKQGWQEFSPWLVRDFLGPNKITAKQLIVSAAHDKKLWFPVQCQVDGQKNNPNHLNFYFSTPASIKRVKYKVGSYEEELDDIFGPTSFKLPIPVNKIDKGKQTLSIAITWRNGSSSTKNYTFYFKPLSE